MKNKFYVYQIIDPRTNFSFYIGKGSGTRIKTHLQKRHLKLSSPKNDKIKEILQTGFKPIFEKFEESLTEEKAFELERNLINEIGLENLTNQTEGGEGSQGWKPPYLWRENQRERMLKEINPMHKPEIRDKHSQILKSEEYKKKMSRATSGIKNGNYGNRGSKSKSSKKYIITIPNGEEIFVHGLRSFCRQYKLNHNYLSYCAKGRRTSYKGFMCRYVEDC